MRVQDSEQAAPAPGPARPASVGPARRHEVALGRADQAGEEQATHRRVPAGAVQSPLKGALQRAGVRELPPRRVAGPGLPLRAVPLGATQRVPDPQVLLPCGPPPGGGARPRRVAPAAPARYSPAPSSSARATSPAATRASAARPGSSAGGDDSAAVGPPSAGEGSGGGGGAADGGARRWRRTEAAATQRSVHDDLKEEGVPFVGFRKTGKRRREIERE